MTSNVQPAEQALGKTAPPKRPPRVKCKSCGKKFNERAGTPFHHLKTLERDVLTATDVREVLAIDLLSWDLLELFGFKVSASSVGG